MPEIDTHSGLKVYIERARKVLQHEQRTNHQDQAIKPGGLEAFVVRWADETSAAWRNAGINIRPIHQFAEHLESYRKMDPMQRAASVRAALTILREMEDTKNTGRDSHPVRGTGNSPSASLEPAHISPDADAVNRADGGRAKAVPTLSLPHDTPQKQLEVPVQHEDIPALAPKA